MSLIVTILIALFPYAFTLVTIEIVNFIENKKIENRLRQIMEECITNWKKQIKSDKKENKNGNT